MKLGDMLQVLIALLHISKALKWFGLLSYIYEPICQLYVGLRVGVCVCVWGGGDSQ